MLWRPDGPEPEPGEAPPWYEPEPEPEREPEPDEDWDSQELPSPLRKRVEIRRAGYR
jgi:hypothetical protein